MVAHASTHLCSTKSIMVPGGLLLTTVAITHDLKIELRNWSSYSCNWRSLVLGLRLLLLLLLIYAGSIDLQSHGLSLWWSVNHMLLVVYLHGAVLGKEFLLIILRQLVFLFLLLSLLLLSSLLSRFLGAVLLCYDFELPQLFFLLPSFL